MQLVVARAVRDIVEEKYSLRQLHKAINKKLAKVPEYEYVVYNACYGGFTYTKAFKEFKKTRGKECCVDRMSDFGKHMALAAPDAFEAFKTTNKGPDRYSRCRNDIYNELSDYVKYGLHRASGEYSRFSISRVPRFTDWDKSEYDGLESVTY